MKLSPISFGLAVLALPSIAGAEIQLQQRLNIRSVQAPAQASKAELPASDPAGSDIIRFENGDIMHGEFGGIAEGLIWKRQDIEQPIRFQMKSVRQIIFNAAKSNDFSKGTSFVTLISGDRVPGEIISMTEKELTLSSPIIGDLTIPRERIRSIAPNPFDGELHYAGPFSSDHWMRLGYIAAEKKEESEDEEEQAEEKDDAQEPAPSWVYSGSAFYSMDRAPLVFDAKLPDVGKLRFKVAYKAAMNISVAFHADLTHPLPPKEVDAPDKQKNEEEDKATDEEAPPKEEPKMPDLEFETLTDLHKDQPFQTVPWMPTGQSNHADFFGTSYVLNIHSSYPSLNRSWFNEDGRANNRRLSTAQSSVSVPPHGETEIEIRFDRTKNLVMLFIDGEYSAQWNDPTDYLAKGSAIGFLNTSINQIRISDIIVSSWNGIKDSASGMNHAERDIALLTNGTDRYSGVLDRIENGKAFLKTSYAQVEIPLSDLSLIELNKNGQADTEDASYGWQTEPASILFKPYGIIQLIPDSATPETLSGHSPFFGDIKVNLKSAVMLRLLDESPDISDWFDEF
ncbi:MAG: hypothetical protein QNL33_01455 [Akkermansiaceae bacterium]|jgi:hypothetical protein